MGLGIIQNLPSMPLDDQWDTIQNWEERHDALETHLERIVSKFFYDSVTFFEYFVFTFLWINFETNWSVGPVKKSIEPEIEPEVPEAVSTEPEAQMNPDLSGMLARKIGDNIQKYPKPAEQNS